MIQYRREMDAQRIRFVDEKTRAFCCCDRALALVTGVLAPRQHIVVVTVRKARERVKEGGQ